MVTEETSAENSDKNSLHSPLSPNKEVVNQWESLPPDVSYPSQPIGANSKLLYEETNVAQPSKGILTKNSFPVTSSGMHNTAPKHFFSPLKTNHNFDSFNLPTVPNRVTSFSTPEQGTNLQNFNIIPEKYPQSEIVPITPFGTPKPRMKLNLEPYIETSPDIIIQSNQEQLPRDSFVNGGNLDELLHDIETISNDILSISNQNISGCLQEITENEITQASILELNQEDDINGVKPYKTELNVVLLPKPMPLIGFDKYQNIKSSMDSLDTFKKSSETLDFCDNTTLPMPDSTHTETPDGAVSNLIQQNSNPFFDNFDPNQNCNYFSDRYNLGFKKELYNYNSCHNSSTSLLPTKLLEKHEAEEKQQCGNIHSDKEDKKVEESTAGKEDKNAINSKSKRTRKVSIYFKGKKDKIARTFSLDPSKLLSSSKHHNNHSETSKPESFEKAHNSNKQPEPTNTSTSKDPATIASSNTANTNSVNTPSSTNPTEHDTKKDSDNKNSSDSKASNYSKHRKSSSTSPERKHLHVKLDECDANKKKGHKKRHKKSERRLPNRKNSLGGEKFREQRSISICTDKSNILDHKFGNNYDDFYTTSERDRSHSLSSCETINSRKMSHVPTLAVAGKIPWFGCWGNGCL